MKHVLFAASLFALTAAPHALAGDGKHTAEMASHAIAVAYSDEFTEELEDEYGEREGAYLAEEVREDIARQLDKRGVAYDTIKVTILDAKPNRPTFHQLSAQPGLSFQSFGVGGMELSAEAYAADGTLLGALEYGWFESNIRDAQGKATWWDARRASSRFARKFAKELAG